MYEVKIINGSEETLIHSPNVNGIKVESGVMKTEINAVDSFDLTLYMDNPGYGKMKPFQTLVKVRNTLTDVYEFEGRVLTPSENMESSGLHSTSFLCEGELAYLHDAQQRHLEFRGTPSDLLHTILNYYNQQVEAHKRFEVGDITVTNSTDNVYVYLTGEQDTFETIKDKLIDRLGGELQIRKVDGVRYLDYLERIGEDRDTKIKLAKNLISMSRDVDPTDIITRLTPLGTRIKSEDETATDASEARLTVESVNNGLPYIDRQDLIDAFGIQGGSITWDDVTVESNLYTAGRNWLNNQKISLNQYKISAVDLSIIGLTIDDFRKGDSYPVDNPIMAIDERLRIIGTSKDVNEPQNGSLTIGDKFKSLYEYENDARKRAKLIDELESNVARQQESLAQTRQEIQTQIGNLQNAIDNIDASEIPELEIAINNLVISVNDLADLVDEIDTPGIATEVEAGLMPADDKVKVNKLTVTDVANLDDIQAKLALLTVVNPIDLDALLNRVEALENEPEPPTEPE